MLERLGRLMYRRRWYVLAVWLVLLAGGAAVAPRVTSVLQGGGYTIGSSQSVDAYNVLNRTYGYHVLAFTVVFTGKDSALMPAARAFDRSVAARFGRSLSVSRPVWTQDHRVVFVRIYSAPLEDFGARYVRPLSSLLPGGAVHTYLTGDSAIFHDMEVVSDQDLRRIEIVTLPLAALVLLVIFGSLVAAAVPVLMAPIAITLALSVVYILGQHMVMSIFVLNTTSMLGLGVAIDYSLFMVNRFRDELEAGADLETAVGRTVATSGRAILVSALVVSIGFYALTLMGVDMLRSIGLSGSIVTSLSLLVALTFLPALLGILGHRINMARVLPRSVSSRAAWARIAHWVMARPWPVIAAVSAIVLVLTLPAFHLRVAVPGRDILPSSVASRAGSEILDSHFGLPNQSPILVVLDRERSTASPFGAAFVELDRICSSSDVLGVAAVPLVNSPRQVISCPALLRGLENPASARRPAPAVSLLSVFVRTDPSSLATEHVVDMLRSGPPIPGYRVLVGGQTAGQIDFDRYLFSRFPLVVLFVVATIYLILLVAFRSVLLPLKAVLINLFSVLAANGVVVFAFQDGRLAHLLGFTPIGSIDSIVPIFLFAVLFGISTDYEVFLLTRVQEEYRRTGDNAESVATGLASTGRIITSAALIMITVFGAFAFARLVVIQELGLGLAVAVLVDATLIRVLLVPATMRVLGRWNWWLPLRGFPTVRVPARRSSAAE